MSVDFEPVSKKSEHGLDEFLAMVPRMERERAEVRVEKNLVQFRSKVTAALPAPQSSRSSMETAFRELRGDLETVTLHTRRGDLIYRAALSKTGRDNWMGEFLPFGSGASQKSEFTISSNESDTARIPETRVVGIGKLQAWFWLGLVLGALLWGIAAGAALFAGVGLSVSVATFGVLGTAALATTMFALSRQDVVRRHER